jgi:hypothetical protein
VGARCQPARDHRRRQYAAVGDQPRGQAIHPDGERPAQPEFQRYPPRTTDNSSSYAVADRDRKRFSDGFQFSSSYTWSKSIDSSSIIVSSGSEFLVSEPWPFDLEVTGACRLGPASLLDDLLSTTCHMEERAPV